MFDVLIINGLIIDGSGREAYSADLGIIGDKISAIGDLKNFSAKEVIDAKDAYVCPGIIDVHTHSDMAVFQDGRFVSQVRQGVTTQITGLCGYSFAPLNEKSQKTIAKKTFYGCNPTWTSFKSYLETLDGLELGTNLGSYVGHANLRDAIMEDPIGKPSEDELNNMVELLDKSVQEGAFGLSTGLEYNPGKASEMNELEAFCKVLSKHNALHSCHTRNRDKYYLTALNEVLDVTRASGARLQISHINPKYGCYENTMAELYANIRRARSQGFHVVADIMPSEWNHTNAIALMPLWAQNLAVEELKSLLESVEGRAKLKQNPNPIWQLAHQDKWDRIYLFGSKVNADLRGNSIAELAKKNNLSGFEMLCALLAAEAPNFSALVLTSNAFSLEDIALAIQDECSSVVSDVVGMAKDGFFKDIIFSPNTYDWFAVFMKNFVINEKPTLSIENAIHKVTAIPAWQLGIEERGLLYQNYYADIMIFNKDRLKTIADLKNPQNHPEGIQAVLVNGKIAYCEGDENIYCHGQTLRFTSQEKM